MAWKSYPQERSEARTTRRKSCGCPTRIGAGLTLASVSGGAPAQASAAGPARFVTCSAVEAKNPAAARHLQRVVAGATQMRIVRRRARTAITLCD